VDLVVIISRIMALMVLAALVAADHQAPLADLITSREPEGMVEAQRFLAKEPVARAAKVAALML
jgi:hypothetical protein